MTEQMSRYHSSARYYDQGRMPYPDDLGERLAAALGLDGRGRLLDVGCGTGAVAVALAAWFDDVVGIDPDAGMIEHARARAAAEPGTRAEFRVAAAEDLPLGLGPLRVATFALSFHWTDRARVAATIHDHLEPGGWFVTISRSQPAWAPPAGAPPRPPMDAVRELVRSYVGDHTQAEPGDDEEVLAAAGFEAPRTVTVHGGRFEERSAEDVIAKVYSQADYAPHLFGDRRPEFEERLRELLSRTSSTGRFTERQPDCKALAWRRPGA